MSNINTDNPREEIDIIVNNNNDYELPLDQAIDKAYENDKFTQEMFDALRTKARRCKKITLGLCEKH